VGEWYYIGHYGQLGPLTREQIDELIEGGVILRETYVWRTGIADWMPAEKVPELQASFRSAEPFAAPPPPPINRPVQPNPSMGRETNYSPVPPVAAPATYPVSPQYPMTFSTVRSDKNRLAGGLLQLFLPGIGRIYLGYPAIGVLQLVLSLCGVGVFWSWIDGIIIISGGLRMDGYGRQLVD
jgi:GYF domain 2/TM2 domain